MNLNTVVSLNDKMRQPRPARKAERRGHIEIDRLSITFGKGASSRPAVLETSLEIQPGEFVCVLGPSGCGKSTMLNSVAGYVRPSAGSVRLDGEPITGPGPERGMVFQQYSLFPWKTIRQNIAFGPMVAGMGAAECESTANTLLEMVGLSKFANSYPAELSGGMQQRVGIARALANYPSVLLMDEPFGALDAQTRLMMQESLLKIWNEFRITVMFVTHDVDEAIFLADRVLIMSASPGAVIADLAIPLPRPRHPDMATTDEFVRLKKICLERIRAESLKAFEQNSH